MSIGLKVLFKIKNCLITGHRHFNGCCDFFTIKKCTIVKTSKNCLKTYVPISFPDYCVSLAWHAIVDWHYHSLHTRAKQIES